MITPEIVINHARVIVCTGRPVTGCVWGGVLGGPCANEPPESGVFCSEHTKQLRSSTDDATVLAWSRLQNDLERQ